MEMFHCLRVVFDVMIVLKALFSRGIGSLVIWSPFIMKFPMAKPIAKKSTTSGIVYFR